MIELFASRHPFLLTAASFIAGTVAAIPVAFLVWHYIVLPGLMQELAIIDSKQVIVTLAGTDKNCLDWREKNGAWSCIRR